MARKRVAVLRSLNLLMAGVVTMLEEQDDLEVRSFAADDADLVSELSAFKPKVAVLDGGDSRLASLHPLGTLLKSFPGMTIIALNLEESHIRAYRQQRVVGAGAEDLLHIIARSAGRRRKGSSTGVTK